MTKALDMTVSGSAALLQSLKKLPDELMRKVIMFATLQSGKHLLAKAKQRAPIGRYGVGAWAGSIRQSLALKTKFAKGSQKQIRMGFVGVTEKQTFKRHVGNRVYTVDPSKYAHLVEYGHRIVARGSKSGKGKARRASGKVMGMVAPRPFLRPVKDAGKRSVESIFQAAVRKKLQNAVRAARKKGALDRRIERVAASIGIS